MHRAPGEFDVAYFLSMSITTEMRREVEIRLLRVYWQRLCEASEGRVTADSYPFVQCLANFQIALVYVARMWVLAGMQLADGDERGARLQESMYARGFATLAEWNVHAALKSLLERGPVPPTAQEATALLPRRVVRELRKLQGGARL